LSTAARRAAELDLEPFRPGIDGDFGGREAAHLLRRACFGGTLEDRERVLDWGPERAADELTDCPPVDGELAATIEALSALAGLDDLVTAQATWLTRMLLDSHPFREQLTLFWHGHFATSVSKVGRVRLLEGQVQTLRDLGRGPFSELLAAVSRDPAMIIWLDGNANRRHHPNENYARELMELFALGEGSYTEQDVLEAARAFTGWHVHRDRFRYTPGEHDDGQKTVLGRSGPLDGDDVLEACLASPACARHVAGRLFRFFVHAAPRPELLDALAERYRSTGYDTVQLVRRLLASREFYAPRTRRAVIRSPVALAVGAARSLALRPDTMRLAAQVSALGQSLYAPPSVKGWDGGTSWINAATLVGRVNLAAQLADSLPEEDIPSREELIELLLDGEAPVGLEEVPEGRPLLQGLLSLPESQLA
jgi:uncharacterized protein (DUF1800 family)